MSNKSNFTITFVRDPIKGFCNVEAPRGSSVDQCIGPDLYVMTDGVNRVAVCEGHRRDLLRHTNYK